MASRLSSNHGQQALHMDAGATLRTGTRHHQAGRLKAAMKAYEQILQKFPDHPDALHLAGLIDHQEGDSDSAIRRIRRAVEQRPENLAFRKNLSVILFAAGKFDEGFQCCRNTIDTFPDCIEIYMLLGNAYLRRQLYQAATECFQEAIRIQPTHADLHHNLGVALHESGEPQKAVVHYRRALELNPDLAEAHYNLGNALRMYAGTSEAVLAAYRSALAARPDYVDASFNLAKALDELERTEEAIHFYRLALKRAPHFAEAQNSLGNAYLKQGENELAVGCYAQAIRINPHFHEAYYNMALACKMQGNLSQAGAFVKQALAQDPECGDAASLLVQILQQACAWSDLETACGRLDTITDKQIAAGKCPSEQPFLNFTRHADPALNLRVAREWSAACVVRVSQMGGVLTQNRRHSRDGKIVIGYVSERFRNAATAHLMLQLFGLHDRQRFTVYAYSYGKDDGSIYRRRIAQDADHFIDIRNLSDPDAARRIRDDGVDIAIDLMGFMKHSRIGIFAFRPAPVQVAYLGYPSTTGATFMDYLIADHVVAPSGEDPYYSERLVRLPHCYQVNDNTQAISAKAFNRRQCGLPEQAFVYCSFNTDYKIDRSTFHAWMDILKRVPGSVLWLLVRSVETQRNLVQAAAGAGIGQDRLVFAQSLPKDEHLARIKLADLALDTHMVNGHTTTSDCLWVNLPVVTLRGSHFASRVSASLLMAVGLSELACDNPEAYVSIAVGLAEDRRRLQEIRTRLHKTKLNEPLFDSARTVRYLETAFMRMWENHTSGRGPQPITIRPDGELDDSELT